MQLTNDQLYNADETGLFYKLLPDKTYVAACEKTAPGTKLKKERITALLCANADGSNKITPLVIGKAKKSRCFKGFNNPLDYDNSSMDGFRHFQELFSWFFVKEVSMNMIFIISSLLEKNI